MKEEILLSLGFFVCHLMFIIIILFYNHHYSYNCNNIILY